MKHAFQCVAVSRFDRLVDALHTHAVTIDINHFTVTLLGFMVVVVEWIFRQPGAQGSAAAIDDQADL